MPAILQALTPQNWKRGVALVILWCYGYQLCAWPALTWAAALVSAATGATWPGPPELPWEAMVAGTGTLAAVGGIETWREQAHYKIGRPT